jgi:hypothetical protein
MYNHLASAFLFPAVRYPTDLTVRFDRFKHRAHGRADPGFPAAVTEGEGSILTAMIGMMDDLLRMTLQDSHLQGIQDELGAQVDRHSPTDDPAAPGVHHDGQVQEPAPGTDVGDIRHPEFVGTAGREVALDQIGRLACSGLSPGRTRRFATADTPQMGLSHQASHPLAPHTQALFGQFGVNARRTIGAFRSLVDLLDLLGQHLVFLLSLGRRSLQPGIEPTGRDFQNAAHAPDRIDGLVVAHELEDFGGTESVSRANQAAAFARISRSSFS